MSSSGRRALIVPGVAGTIAQLSQGVVGLSLLLVGHAAHFAVSTSAIAVSAAAVGMSITRPAQGRALDRFSPRAVFVAFGALHGAAFALVAVAAQQHWPAVFVLTGCCVGLSLPPIATLMRAQWPARVDPASATGMFALIASLQMISVLTAPLLFTIVNAASNATAAMLVIAVVSAVGTIAFGVVAGSARLARTAPGERVGVRGYLAPLVLTVLLGAVIGTTQVAAPALAIAASHASEAGLLVATATVGALLGSAVGMSRWGRRLPTRRLLLTSTVVQLLGGVLVVLPVPLAFTVPGLLLLGLGDTPAMAALSAAIAVRARGSAESFGWQSTGQGLGMAGGSALAGALAALGAHVAAAPAIVAAAVCVAAGSRLGADAVSGTDARPRSDASSPSTAPPRPVAAPRPRH